VATARREHNARAAQYLLGLPLLGDYLEDGLAMFDEFVVDQDDKREGSMRGRAAGQYARPSTASVNQTSISPLR